MLALQKSIEARATQLTKFKVMERNFELATTNRILAVHASLAIEGNRLTLAQVAALQNRKLVAAPPKDVQEAQNAIAAYDRLFCLDPYDVMDFLKAHEILTKSLLPEPGQFRTRHVGVFRGKELIYLAPHPDSVSDLMADLFRWAKESAVHPLIKSVIFHYQTEFIHPFLDGNGRMGRLWQTHLLSMWQYAFIWLPVEAYVYDRQQDYYNALRVSQDTEDCTQFILFMLQVIWDALEKRSPSADAPDPLVDRVNRLLDVIGTESFSVPELMQAMDYKKSRRSFCFEYLDAATMMGLVEMTLPDKPQSKYQRYRRSAEK